MEYLRNYLDYAERGTTRLAIPYSSTGLEPDSPFEESVIKAIQGWGYTVEPQVGAAGFRIDIGVRHPAYPGMFAIGIECDGYQYHSAPAARDRDRLRDQVLTGLGWTLHRIWGTAWYRNRGQEETRLQQAIECRHRRTRTGPQHEDAAHRAPGHRDRRGRDEQRPRPGPATTRSPRTTATALLGGPGRVRQPPPHGRAASLRSSRPKALCTSN